MPNRVEPALAHTPDVGKYAALCRRNHGCGAGSGARQDENWLSLGCFARRPRLERISAAGVPLSTRARNGEYAAEILDGFNGTIQVDAYGGYSHLATPKRTGGESLRLDLLLGSGSFLKNVSTSSRLSLRRMTAFPVGSAA